MLWYNVLNLVNLPKPSHGSNYFEEVLTGLATWTTDQGSHTMSQAGRAWGFMLSDHHLEHFNNFILNFLFCFVSEVPWDKTTHPELCLRLSASSCRGFQMCTHPSPSHLPLLAPSPDPAHNCCSPALPGGHQPRGVCGGRSGRQVSCPAQDGKGQWLSLPTMSWGFALALQGSPCPKETILCYGISVMQE